jgi:RNA polymerase sigma-70 factor (ECF subfamily)
MTVLVPSMSLPTVAQAPQGKGKADVLPEAAQRLDAEARRIAAGVARGDESAFRELYDHYQNRLFRLALLIGEGNEVLAHETVQTVFLTAASKLRRVENEAHLWNWLARVARQEIGKAWRRNGRELNVAELSEIPECPQGVESDSELEERLEAALLATNEEDRQVIEWFYFDGLSQKEIAERLKATPKAVSSRLERARAKLKSLVRRPTLAVKANEQPDLRKL